MATVAQPVAAAQPQRKNNTLSRREAAWGAAFLSPWIIGFLAFTLLPMIASLVLSFMEFSTTHPEQAHFIGLENWQQLFRDPLVSQALKVSFIFTAISVPIGIIVPLLQAALLNSPRLWAQPFFRTLFFMPSMVPLVSAILIWGGMLNTDRGWINAALEAILNPILATLQPVLLGAGIAIPAAITPPDWLYSQAWIYPAFTIMGLWGVGNTMLLMLASMQGVPTELYDAARVDGATTARTFVSITIPMISPVIMYNLVISLIGTLQYFTVPFVIKNGTGDPANATLFFVLYLFKSAFTFQQMGYAATLAWLLFIIGVVLTVILFGTQRYWVYYAGGER